MNFKTKIVTALFAGALAAGIAACPASTVYAKDKATDTKVVAPTEGYWQKSANYDYKIFCPKKPIGVIPAKLFFDDNSKKGDVIIFETFGDIYNVKTAWVVLVDAFKPDAFPDLTKLPEDDAKAMLKKIQESNGYLFIGMMDLPNKNKGIFAVTAKEVEIDSDNDGKVDAIAKSDNQTAVTFFRGQYGGRFCVQLLDNPELRPAVLEEYRNGVLSFTELKPETNAPKKGNKKK